MLAVVPAWFTLSVLVFDVKWPVKALVATVLAASILSPVTGFLVAVAFAPLGRLVAVMLSMEGFRIGEAMVVAFLAGWVLRAGVEREGPGVPRAIGWLLAVIVVTSLVGVGWRLGRFPGELSRDVDLIVHAYYFLPERVGFRESARILEGLGLAAAAVTLFRERPRLAVTLPVVLAVSAVLASIASVLLWYGVAPAAILQQYAVNRYRVTAHVPDANAAASYFAMIVCLTLGMAFRARGRERVGWIVLSGAIAMALWLTASRSAVAVAGITVVLAAAWVVSNRRRSRWTAVAAAGLVVLLTAMGGAQLWRASGNQLSRGSSFRAQFNETSLRMMSARPLAGVGIGQYVPASTLFLTPELAWAYGSENAHNYFLQIGAELGLPGLALFTAFIGAGIWRGIRALAATPRDVRLLGAFCGVAAFVATCVVSHPLLLDEVAFPFWVQFGLVLALAGSTLYDRAPQTSGEAVDRARRRQGPAALAAAAAIAYVVAAAPFSALGRDIEPPQSQAVDGFYGWETDADGTPFRWTEQYASVFIPPGVARIEIPIRMPAGVPWLRPVAVRASIGGRARPPELAGGRWSMLSLDVPPIQPPLRFQRVNLGVERTLQPALYMPGSADFRAVGVQVGKVNFLR